MLPRQANILARHPLRKDTVYWMTSHSQDLTIHWLWPVLAPVLGQLMGQPPPQMTEKSADSTHNGLKISPGYL